MPFMRVTRKGSFEAAHFNEAIGGKCARLHGHRYEYEVFARGHTDDRTGIVIDFRDLKKAMKEIEEVVDHQCLNDILPFIPSAENLCHWIYKQMKAKFPEVYRVVLYETADASAEYNEDDDFVLEREWAKL